MLGKQLLAIVVLAISWNGHAAATEVAPYLESPLEGHPRANAGFAINDGTSSIRASVAVRSESAETKALPQVSYERALADRIGLVARVKLPDWNGDVGRSSAAFDTRLQFEPRTAFVDRIEGRIHRAVDGVERHSLRLGFSDNLGQGDSPGSLVVRGNAIIEETLRPADGNSLGMGVEATVTGFSTPALGLDFLEFGDASSSLSLSLRRASDVAAEQGSVASFAYDHAWAFQDSAQLRLKLQAIQAADRVEPVMGISWQGAF